MTSAMTPEPTKAMRVSMESSLERDHLAGVADHPREALPAEEGVHGGLDLRRCRARACGPRRCRRRSG